VRVLGPSPLGHPPIDEHLDLRISPELSLQIRVDVGMTSGHDEQIIRHLPVLPNSPIVIQVERGWRLEAL
jgi:hypothetical protein